MIVNAMMALLMGLFMGVTTLLIEHTPINWVSLITMWSKITFVVTIVLMLVPVSELGNKFAAMLKCRPGTLVSTLVANLVPTFIINTVLAATVPALGIFYNEAIPADARMGEWKAAFFGTWLLTYVISYFFGLLSAKIGAIVAARTLGE